MKRILYVSSVDVSLTSGPATNEREFISHLFKLLGERAHFLIPRPENGLPADIPAKVCTLSSPHMHRNPFWSLVHQISILKNVRKLLKRHSYDLIVFRLGVFDISPWYISKRFDIPYALKTVGSGRFEIFEEKNWLVRKLKPINQVIFNELVRNSIVTDVVSEALRASLVEVTGAGERVVCVDNGVNTKRFVPQGTWDSRRQLGLNEKLTDLVGYAGNFPWKRGAMQIVEALPALSARHPGIGALIVGSGPKMSLLYDRANELGVYDRCIFVGQVDYDEVPLFINAMDVGVSMRDENTQHASELKVRQYLACGKPVIVTPGSNDFVEREELGYVLNVDASGEFVDSVSRILSLDKGDYQALSRRASTYARKNLSYDAKIEQRLRLWSVAID